MDKKPFRQLIGASLCALGFLAAPAPSRADDTDAWITAKTKIALATSDKVSAMDVNVDTVDGRVTLHGMVPTDSAKRNAKVIAAGIEGVKEVRDLLQVVADEKADVVEAKDEVIHDAVTRALAADEITNDSDIEVQSVNAGVVLLSGQADSLLQHLEAIRVANRVDGVRQVATQVKSDDVLYDEKLWHDPAHKGAREQGAMQDAKDAAKDVGTTVKDAAVTAGAAVRDGAVAAGEKTGEAAGGASDAVKDAWITTAAKTRLIANSEVPASSVNVDTEDGIVTLFGVVPTQSAKTAAEAEVRKVSGVVDVRNRLDVAAAPPNRSSAAIDY